MKKYDPPSKGMTAQDQQRLVLPLLVSVVLFLVVLAIYSIQFFFTGDVSGIFLFVLGCLGIIASLTLYYLVLPKSQLLERLKWVIAGAAGLGLGLIAIFIPGQIFSIFIFLCLLSVISIAVLIGREATLLMIAIITTMTLLSIQGEDNDWPTIVQAIGLPIVMLAVSETIFRSSDVLFKRILRMGEINDFARKIASSLETDQVIRLLSASVQDALDADTYIIGLVVDKDFLQLDLFYDDGDYYPPERIPLSGSLSGWVIRNDQPLFLPDLRQEPDLEDVRLKIIGKDKVSLSWMGVPIHTAHFKGIIAVASYQPNAFDRMDMQLLENLAQQAVFALDNAHHHTEVEFQSQLDSLTGVYNHGFFLKDARKTR